MPASDDLPITLFPDAASFSTWLTTNHAGSPGLWLQLAKKGAALRSLTYVEAIEVALCWGWIDGQKQAHDDASWLQRFTRRGPRSLWSVINRERALALIAAKRMHPPGLAEVERAQADGRWQAAYSPPSRAEPPDDFKRALAADPKAAAAFTTLDAANRYAMIWRIETAKKAETRARHIAKFIAMLRNGEKLHG